MHQPQSFDLKFFLIGSTSHTFMNILHQRVDRAGRTRGRSSCLGQASSLRKPETLNPKEQFAAIGASGLEFQGLWSLMLGG